MSLVSYGNGNLSLTAPAQLLHYGNSVVQGPPSADSTALTAQDEH